jgi:D-arabinose 1-dehydrogenase-like Zn-dependent alcohol dehydrogenase
VEEEFAVRSGVDAAIVFAPSDATVQRPSKCSNPAESLCSVSAHDGEWSFDEKRLVSTALASRHQMQEVLRLAADGKHSSQGDPLRARVLLVA